MAASVLSVEQEKLFPNPEVRDLVAQISKSQRYPEMRLCTSYKLLDDNLSVVKQMDEQNCFAYLAQEIRGCLTPPKWVSYKADFTTTRTQFVQWVELCLAMGALVVPPDATAEDIVTDGVMIDLTDPRATVPRVYMTLCLIRWAREAPYLIKYSMELINKVGVDPWAAIAYCHNRHCHFPDQSLFPFKENLAQTGHSIGVESNLALVLQAYLLLYDPDSIDDRNYLEAARAPGTFMWKWHTNAMLPGVRWILEDRMAMLSNEVLPVITAPSLEEGKKRVKQLQRESKHVRFKEIT